MGRSGLIVTLALWGWMAIPGYAEPISITGSIAGPDGRPVRGASVELVPVLSRFAAGELWLQGKTLPEPIARTVSRADGRFEIAAPAPGMWELHVTSPSMVATTVSLTPLLEPREISRLEMARELPLRVRVIDPQGKPVAGARVVAMSFVWQRDPQTSLRRPVTTTGPDGTAVLSVAQAPRTEIWAAAPGYPVASLRVEGEATETELRLAAGCPRTVQVTGQVTGRTADGGARPVEGALVRQQGWTLGATDASGRLALSAPCDRDLPLTAEARDGRWAEVTLRRGPQKPAAEAPPLGIVLPAQPIRLSGRVQEKGTRKPVPGALVWSSADPATFVRTDSKGAYTVPLTAPHETTPLAAAAAGYLEDIRQARAGEAGPTLSLTPASTASGVVVDEAGRPVADAEIEVEVMNPERSGAWGRSASGRSDAQGRFRLSALAGEALSLTARHPDFVPAKLTLPQLAPRSSRSGLRVVLARGLSAAGRVLDAGGQPVAGAEVWLARSREEEWDPMRRPASAVTDAEGRFTLHHLEPGRADLMATARGFAPTRVPGLEIAAGPAGSGLLDLGTVTLAPGVALRGVVVDPGDSPVAGAQVVVRGVSGYIPRGSNPTGSEEVLTTADGTFIIPDLSPGARVSLGVRKKGYTRTELGSVQVPPVEPLRIVLAPGSRVAGRIVDESGEPVPFAIVSLSRIGTESGAGFFESEHLAGTGRSESDGSFEIDGVPAGKVRLLARHDIFLDGEIPLLEVVAGRDIENLELALRRGAVITGRVTGPDGEPVENGSVAAVQGSGGAAFFPSFRGARTDADGRYRIEGVPDGVHSFEARGTGHQPLIREAQVKSGENRLDFRLAAGHEVSGRVLDAAGAPVAGARVDLTAPGSSALRSQPGYQREGVLTGADGSFRIESAVTGVYDVQAAKEEYAPGRLAGVAVAGPVQGLELRLEAGGSIQGSLTGLDLADLASVGISALAGDGRTYMSASGQVDYQGRYRIDGLAAGEWRVSATAPDGRHASGRVRVAPGAETVLDLDFKESGGLTLTGRILRGGEPVANAAIVVWSQEGPGGSQGSDQTGPQGEFRIRGLAPGAYNMRAVLSDSHVEHRGTVELTGDRDILVEISGHRVTGRVIDATDQSPIPRASVAMEATAIGPGLPYSPPREAGTDEKGVFTLTDVAPGTYRLKARVDGYALTETTVELTEEGVDGVVLALQPTEGLVLEVRGALGSPPPEARIALMDAAGRVVLAHSHPTGENGRVRLPSAPPGTWQLLVTATGYASIEQTVRVPGPPVPVVLPRSSTLTVSAPGLPAGSGVTVTGAGGRPLRLVAWGDVQQQWLLHEGLLVLDGVPPGRWQVRVTAPDGQAWEAAVTTVAGQPARVVVR